jgi:hypothetical protein
MDASLVSIACIIPAFNEEATVATVARRAVAHPKIHRVIVVDDGSKDATTRRASLVAGVQVITLQHNRGKGAAMRIGMAACVEPVLLFLDADLLGLTPQHISDLLDPVLTGEAEMSVGLFRGGRIHTDLAHMVAPSLSGQRAIHRSALQHLDMASVGFGIERALTELWENGTIRVKEVILHGVSHRTKEEKRGYLEGVKQRLGMYSDILRFEKGRLKRRLEGNSDTLGR